MGHEEVTKGAKEPAQQQDSQCSFGKTDPSSGTKWTLGHELKLYVELTMIPSSALIIQSAKLRAKRLFLSAVREDWQRLVARRNPGSRSRNPARNVLAVTLEVLSESSDQTRLLPSDEVEMIPNREKGEPEKQGE